MPDRTPEVLDRATAIALMRVALVNLEIDDEGLSRRNRLPHLDRVAGLTAAVIAATADGESPHDLLAGRLAHCTRRLLTTLFDVGDDDRKTVREYLLARAELIALD